MIRVVVVVAVVAAAADILVVDTRQMLDVGVVGMDRVLMDKVVVVTVEEEEEAGRFRFSFLCILFHFFRILIAERMKIPLKRKGSSHLLVFTILDPTHLSSLIQGNSVLTVVIVLLIINWSLIDQTFTC